MCEYVNIYQGLFFLFGEKHSDPKDSLFIYFFLLCMPTFMKEHLRLYFFFTTFKRKKLGEKLTINVP